MWSTTTARTWKDHYDFIVVGGGAAGNVVAGRLSENPNVKVLVIEAGPGNPEQVPELAIPAHAVESRSTKYDWSYTSTFVDRPDYERVEKTNISGKILGGTSSLNYCTWVPGSKGTFNAWAEYGGRDWTWDKCEEYFTKSTRYHDDNRNYDPKFWQLGRDGPLHISHASLLPETAAFRKALTNAWESKGLPLNDDIFFGDMKGLAHVVNTVNKGFRSSGLDFLANKPNVDVMSLTVTRKINFDQEKAASVTVICSDGSEATFKARKEIILSGGAFETPKLLLLSGIGPRTELARHGIQPVIISEHVGENLLDHPIMPHVFRIKDGIGLDGILLREGPLHDHAVRQYQESKTGPLASGLLELIAFPRIDEQLEKYREYRDAKEQNGGKDPFGPEGQPHFEIDFVPMFCKAFQWHFPVPSEGDWLTVIVDLLRPQSKSGFVRLTSLDPHEQPNIHLDYFSNPLDILALREGVRFINDILMTGNDMRDIIREDYPWPMSRESDEEMDRMILDRAQTGHHPCGTARLSKDIAQGVVDPDLRVHGAINLRVVDASIIPVITDCKIQNSVYMIGEKGADIIKSSHPSLYGQYRDSTVPAS
ncbi:Glucose-methanol-choline oxidoreductase [Penicillium angulare]|uniref:Glucose-methanol-choline oxidoreductase n=1 Tax=Penicillium angulare TaxID=116970 RepID=A0A9W9FXZ8_9EURO|nr:Glucose-methanol-choline oxidoreductase [Penicillium angulare]